MKKNYFLSKIGYYISMFLLIFIIFPFFVVKVFGVLNAQEVGNINSNNINTNNVNEIDMGSFKAIWFSFIEWQTYHNGKNEQEWRNIIKNEIIKNLKSFNINNVLVHAVAHSDSFFKTNLYPCAQEVSKEYGKVIDYDPFKIFVDELKSNGFKVHAWINPLRGMKDEEYLKINDCYKTKQWYLNNRSDYYMKDKSKRYWLNPSNPEVRNFIKDVVEEIIKNYNIDGVHIDDYFYPAGLSENNVEENDLAYFNKVNPGKDVNNWRRQSITELIKGLYESCSSKGKIFGISPQGNMKNNFNNMFFDQKDVLEKGYLDYIMPQIYFGFENEVCPFNCCVEEWRNFILKNKKKDKKIYFYVGLAAYKCGMQNDVYAKKGSKEWFLNNDILKKQINFLKDKSDGFTFFSYESLFSPTEDRRQKIEEEKRNLLDVLKCQTT